MAVRAGALPIHLRGASGLDGTHGTGRRAGRKLHLRPATDGTGLRRLSALGSDQQALAWSPDGQTIALDYYDAIFAMPASGDAMAKIMAGGDATDLDWKAGP